MPDPPLGRRPGRPGRPRSRRRRRVTHHPAARGRVSQSSRSATTPRVATWTTVPGKPSSATTRLLPPREEQQRAAGLVGRRVTASTQLGLGGRLDPGRGPGPPSRRVVWSRADELRHAPRPWACRAPSGPPQVTSRAIVARPSSTSLTVPATTHLDTVVVVGHDDRVGELAAELDDLGAAGPVRDGARGQRHREHAVGDHARQPDRGGDPVGPVDRVEVAARAGVADQVGAA